jgi:iron complex outermembrane recepter protein
MRIAPCVLVIVVLCAPLKVRAGEDLAGQADPQPPLALPTENQQAPGPPEPRPIPQTADTFYRLSLEDLLNVNVSVVTSGKQSTQIREVPESVWVLSAEDIRRSGASNVPELLRLVPGLDVVELAPGHYDVAIRNHENVNPNVILVMMDSRPINLQALNINVWAAMPVVVEDIERIEVVLGPGSVLHGSNAIRGIINIITSRPDRDGLRLRAMGGTQLGFGYSRYDAAYVGGSWDKKMGPWGTSLAASYDRSPPWQQDVFLSDPTRAFPADQSFRGTGQIHFTPKENRRLALRVGGSDFRGNYFPFYRSPTEAQMYFGEVHYTDRGLLSKADEIEATSRFRGDHFSTEYLFDPNLPASPLKITEESYDVSVLYRLTHWKIMSTSAGVETETRRFRGTMLRSDLHGLSDLGVWIQEKITPSQHLVVTGGVRVQKRFAPGVYEQPMLVPKLSVVWLPKQQHSVRLSVSEGMRNPSLLELYSDARLLDGTLRLMGGTPGVKPEWALAFEAGYQYNRGNQLVFKLDGFYHRRNRAIYPFSDPTGTYLVSFVNDPNVEVTAGGETGLSWAAARSLVLKLAYGLVFNPDDTHTFGLPSLPAHHVYANLATNPWKELEVDANAFFMSMYQQAALVGDRQAMNPITILNLRIAYPVLRGLRVFATGSNLLAHRWGSTFVTGALDTQHQVPQADVIGRRVMIGVEANR